MYDSGENIQRATTVLKWRKKDAENAGKYTRHYWNHRCLALGNATSSTDEAENSNGIEASEEIGVCILNDFTGKRAGSRSPVSGSSPAKSREPIPLTNASHRKSEPKVISKQVAVECAGKPLTSRIHHGADGTSQRSLETILTREQVEINNDTAATNPSPCEISQIAYYDNITKIARVSPRLKGPAKPASSDTGNGSNHVAVHQHKQTSTPRNGFSEAEESSTAAEEEVTRPVATSVSPERRHEKPQVSR